jgi:alpha-D-xyloside xylohydrolase
MIKKRTLFLYLALFMGTTGVAIGQWNPLVPVTAVKPEEDGIVLTLSTGVMRLQVCSDSMVRVMYAPGTSFPDRKEFVVLKTKWAPAKWSMQSTADEVTVTTERLKVTVQRKDSRIVFSDLSGKQLFEQTEFSMKPVTVNGESTYHAEMYSKLWGSYEAFYGLGQHQSGIWNYRGEAVDISQDNTNIGVPFFLSSNGYGVFWNNTSRSRFNNRFLSALYLSSEVADAIDYYFIHGPEFDRIIGGYRELTGTPPMFGKWAYGFWQCKNRYKTQAEITSVARKYRELGIPVDNIVQDWFWWITMGEPVFDKTRYPDPKGMFDELHKENFHVMISVWPYFRPGTATYDEMAKKGFFIDKTRVAGFHPAGQALYDAFNPEARKYYWGLMNGALFKIGADAWWLDTDEPETEDRETNIVATNRTALGSGARYADMYPLMHTEGVYEGQRAGSDQKRVFILSRSAFAGSQRNAAAVWSGDINSDWTFFRKQIPAGLNYSLSGLPYWTTDIGGFVSGDPNDPAYRELFIRWFEFGTFNPILRVHGTRSTDQNELWSYGADAQRILVSYDRLRYRLLPYIYSVAWKTTSEGYTPMRALVIDYREDAQAANLGDQFMYGPAILVNPVTEPGASQRHLYLPKSAWYDFWTGARVDGGRYVDSAAPIDKMPLYVRAGSILPMGPEMEWSTERPEDPIELRVYRGADGEFTLYEDENDNYDYEKGAYATIPMRWDDAKQTLTIGERKGQFPGMLQSRTFRVVFVAEKHGAGGGTEQKADEVVAYAGREVMVSPR